MGGRVDECEKHFTKFKSMPNSVIDEILKNVKRKDFDEMNESLQKDVLPKEIQEALFHLRRYLAPCSNGFMIIFYKKILGHNQR